MLFLKKANEIYVSNKLSVKTAQHKQIINFVLPCKKAMCGTPPFSPCGVGLVAVLSGKAVGIIWGGGFRVQ